MTQIVLLLCYQGKGSQEGKVKKSQEKWREAKESKEIMYVQEIKKSKVK